MRCATMRPVRLASRVLAAALVVALLAGVTLTIPAVAQTAQPDADLDTLRDEIARMRRRLEGVQQQTASAERDLQQIDLELGIRTRELEIARQTELRLAGEQKALEANVAQLATRTAVQKEELRRRLVALYRMGNLSYLRVLLSLEGERNPIEAVSMLSYLVSRDARAVSAFQRTQHQLDTQQAQLRSRRSDIQQTRLVMESRQRLIAASHQQKETLLAQLRAQESGSERQLAALEEKARRLERLVGILSQQNRGLPVTADILAVQGALDWPIKGNVIEHFGKQRNPKFATVTMNNGIRIAAVPGTPVRSIFGGTVLFSQWFKGYGNLIILDHGNRVFSLYGNVKAPAVTVGDRVLAGQSIAGAGEGEEAASGHLYLEIRKDNRPENPLSWLR